MKLFPSFKDYLPLIRLELRLLGYTRGQSYFWNSETNRFCVYKLSWNPGAIASIVLTGFMQLSVFLRMGIVLQNSKPMNHITSLFIFVGTFMAYCLGLVQYKNAEEIVRCFNSFMRFEENRQTNLDKDCVSQVGLARNGKRSIFNKFKLLQKYFHTEFKLLVADLKNGEPGRLILLSASLCHIMCPACVFFIVYHSPCSFQVFLRSTLSDCKNYGFAWMPAAISPIAVFLDVYFILVTWSQGVTGYASIFYFLALYTRTQLKRLYAEVKMIGSKFDLADNTVKLYKEIQILERQFNNINRGGNLMLIMTDVIFLCVISLYSIIALYDVISLPILAWCVLVAVEGVVIVQMVMYRTAADVNTVSGNIKEEWRHNRYIQRDRYLKRQTRSCAIMKIMVGESGNFLDKTTPLVTSQLTVEQTASLLLMT